MLLVSRRFFLVASSGIFAGLLVGCSRDADASRTPPPDPAATTVVARVGNRSITLEALERELALRVGSRPSREARERILREMLDREAMVLRAREAGFDREPHVQAQMDRLLASLWREEQSARRLSEPVAVTDAEVAAFYAANEHDFRKPGAVRAGVIRFAFSASGSAEIRKQVRERAETVRALAVQADDPAYRQLVRQHSDDQSTRYIGGDTGWIEDGQPAGRWDPEIIAAVRRLAQPGDVAEVVETSHGLHLVRLLDRRAAAPVPLPDVVDAIRYRLVRQKEAEQQTAFLNEIKDGLEIDINRPLLESIPVSADGESPPAMPGG